MKKQMRNIAFMLGMALAPLTLSPVLLHAQQVNEDQRAYDAGYQNGVNDARRHKAMNLTTSDWHGDRVNFYQDGYRKGYASAAGYPTGGPAVGEHVHYDDAEAQRAYDTGYENGVHAREENRPMNPTTGDWHGDRLDAYQRGYEQGYQSVGPR
jgi:ribosome modulation factor